ncbi:hypothetical protein Tco_1284375 [Tanacetum coccineum]
MFEANVVDELWKNQEDWILKSWNLYENCGVYILMLEDGTEFHMLAERKYLLTKETLEKMLVLRLTAESESEAAFDLLRLVLLVEDFAAAEVLKNLLQVVSAVRVNINTVFICTSEGTNATDAPKQTHVVPKKTTATSKKKRLKRKLLEIETQRAIKASGRERRFQHQTYGSSKGADLRPEVLDELTGKSTDSDEGAGISTWYKDEKPEDIPWQSTDDEESENDDEEDKSDEDKSINIAKTDDERTDTDDEDTIMDKAEKTVKQKEDEKHEAHEEQKGDEHAGDKQVLVPISTTQQERPSLLQSTSSHSVSSNFGNQFINSPNASLFGTILENVEAEINSLLHVQIQQDVPNIHQEPYHPVIMLVIPETTQQPPTPLLPATEITSTQVPNSEAVNSVVQRFTALEQAVKELKQVDHSIAIFASIRSQVPLVVEDYLGSSFPDALKKYLPHTVNEALEKTPSFLGQSSFQGQSAIQAAESLSEYEPKKILYTKMHKSQSNLTHVMHQELFDALTWSMLLNEANTEKEEPVDDPIFEKASDDVQQAFDDKVDDASQPPHTVSNKT